MAQTKSGEGGVPNSIVRGFTRLKQAGDLLNAPSGFIIQDSQGFDYYLWFDTSGNLRCTDASTAETAGFNWNSGGTKVGTQT